MYIVNGIVKTKIMSCYISDNLDLDVAVVIEPSQRM